MPATLEATGRQERIDSAIKDCAAAMLPNIKEALCSDFRGTVSVSVHVQDGVLNHVRSTSEESVGLDAKEQRTDPHPDDVSGVMRRIGPMLRLKLLQPLSPGFHGTVVLALKFENGKLTEAKASSERVTKPTLVGRR